MYIAIIYDHLQVMPNGHGFPTGHLQSLPNLNKNEKSQNKELLEIVICYLCKLYYWFYATFLGGMTELYIHKLKTMVF